VAVTSAEPHAHHLHHHPNDVSTTSLKFFTGRMLFLMPNQQCQSTEGLRYKRTIKWKWIYELKKKNIITFVFSSVL